MFCKRCGEVLNDHVEAVEREFDNILDGKTRNRVKVKTKIGAKDKQESMQV